MESHTEKNQPHKIGSYRQSQLHYSLVERISSLYHLPWGGFNARKTVAQKAGMTLIEQVPALCWVVLTNRSTNVHIRIRWSASRASSKVVMVHKHVITIEW